MGLEVSYVRSRAFGSAPWILVAQAQCDRASYGNYTRRTIYRLASVGLLAGGVKRPEATE